MEHLLDFLWELFSLGREKNRGCSFALLGSLALLIFIALITLWLIFKP
jgi:hypothetical protein